MPSARPLNTSSGDRGEYLVQYLLSYIGLPLPVLRQLDIGIDFICNISKEESNLLTYSHPFSVQVKKLNEGTNQLSSPIKFGGIRNKKWRKYEIDWLFNPGIPFFIGILDIKENNLFIYSTSSIWFSYHSDKFPAEIILEPRIYSSNYLEVHGPKKSDFENPNSIEIESDYKLHTVDLGQPIVHLSIRNILDTKYIQEQKRILKYFIDKIEERNIIQKKIESPFFWWNKFNNNSGHAWYGNPWSPKFNPSRVEEELFPLIFSLLEFYFENKSKINTKLNADYLRSIWRNVPPELYDRINHICEWCDSEE